MATVEQAEHMEQMVTASLTRSSARLSVEMSQHGLRAAINGLQNAARRLQSSGPARGQITLQAFAKVAQERDVVGLEHREIVRDVRRELARYGVTFAIEKGRDGGSTVHVQGKDSKLVAHALERAEEALDRRIARREVRAETAAKIKERVGELREERREKRELRREQDRAAPKLDDAENLQRPSRGR